MTHLSEDSHRLKVKEVAIGNLQQLRKFTNDYNQVCLVRLPAQASDAPNFRLEQVEELLVEVTRNLGPESTLIVVGEPVDLVAVHGALTDVNYQLWISIKRQTPRPVLDASRLPEHHFGALVYTRYEGSLQHTKTRIEYTYCPACDKTTKDYGGKKHTYHHYGTLISDVWRDIPCDLEGDITPAIERFSDLFGLEPYQELMVVDTRPLNLARIAILPEKSVSTRQINRVAANRLINGDCIKELQKIPDNSVDFAFADPPYNLGKNYRGYSDDIKIAEYFQWCDEWLTEVGRVLKPGRTCAVLNIPLWATRHFQHLETILQFQNWITWDALSFPVRRIMPAHYTILAFSKGPSRPLPGLTGKAGATKTPFTPAYFRALEPMGEGYCLRASCINMRQQTKVSDRGPLTDMWWDIHRLKHNSRRVDHPTQLPPHLMYRLISIFSGPNEVVLDCFNGSGTTTLAAHQLDRQYLGIEKDEKYYTMGLERHQEIEHGLDPFRKTNGTPTAKNSRVARLRKQTYEVPKKTLQLEVKRVAENLGHLPTRDELIEHGQYPIEYYDEYFSSWGEVCAAARTTGMTENRPAQQVEREVESEYIQKRLF